MQSVQFINNEGSDMPILSEKHGVNPMIPHCFYCGEAKAEVAFMGRLPGDAEAPRNAVIDKEPCDRCVRYMEQGIIFIGVDESKTTDKQNPYRTGKFVVVKQEAVESLPLDQKVKAHIIAKRMAFIPVEVWTRIGLDDAHLGPPPGFKANKYAGQFDFKRAWAEVAKPAFDVLPQNIRDLYERVCEEAKGLSQESGTLNMPWPDQYAEAAHHQVSLKLAFEEIPAEWLARRAHIVYFYGHWSPAAHSYRGNGGTWKFANYADQILRARCGLNVVSSNKYKTSGITYQIHNGLLRVCYEDQHSWLWKEVGLGTPETFERAKQFDDTGVGRRPDGYGAEGSYNDKWSGRERQAVSFEPWAAKMADALWPKGGFMAQFKDISKTFVEPEYILIKEVE